ncbi:MAG TPA: DEAD/DEAH box helicase [Methylovirgula sp.]
MTHPTFAELGFSEPICRALAAHHYSQPTPIQARAIPLLLEGRDLLGIAQTGTGKTAAFALPILQKLSLEKPAPQRAIRALILAPTRELAIQIDQSFATYGKHLGLRHTVIVGGVGQGNQVKALARGVDIVIATPGRLLDLVEQRHAHLNSVQYLVLDEADRMLDMGFINDIRKIIAKLPRQRQSLLFSATMPKDIARLADEVLNAPVRVEVTPQVVTVDRIEQRLYFAETAQKRALLLTLLDDPALSRVIVFTRTKSHANRVGDQLNRAGIATDALHGNKSQNARQRALENFRKGDVRVLVATDIAARGIDVEGVSHVVNYELPNEPESYVHRIGRTARAGKTGIALAFCDQSERAYLRAIERLTKRPLTIEAVPAGVTAQALPKKSAQQPKPQGTQQAKPHGKAHGNRSEAKPAASSSKRRRSWHRGKASRAA